MQFNEQLTLFQMAYELMKNDQYRLIHMKENEKEIWLEKTEQKKTNVIRLQQGGFDWKNYLKRDIAQVFQITKGMKKLFTGKDVTIHNIYVSTYEPVDDWDQLKKPLQLDEKNHPIRMHVYYIKGDTKEDELNRLQDKLMSAPFSKESITTDNEANEALTLYQQTFYRLIQSTKKTKKVFSFGKPFYTYIIIGINLLMYLLLEIGGGSTNIPTLIKFGANYNTSIVVDNEWWRIVSSMFLHIGFLHLVMNMIAVYYIGSIVERIFGGKRFLFIYFLAGIGGGLASFLFPGGVSAGASGAIFGLFGALLFFGLMYKQLFFQTMGKGVLLIIGINIVFGFTAPNIDMAAHIGGLITGFIASVIVFLPNKKQYNLQIGAITLYLFLIVAMVFIGTQQTEKGGNYYLYQMDELISDEDYQTVVDLATEGLENTTDMEVHLRFQRSYANIHLDHTKKAIDDLLEVTEIDPTYVKAYHNLASIYYNKGDIDQAKDAIEMAVEIDKTPSNQKLYKRIFGEKPPS